MMIWRIAWRSLWRNGRRTGLAVAAIGLSVALVLVLNGLLHAESDALLDNVTGPMLGHVQVHAPDWRRLRSLDRTLTGVSVMIGALRQDPDVVSASARIYAPALAARGEEGFGVVVVGLDFVEETRPTRLLAGVTPPASHEVLVGRQLAEQMQIRPGDQIAIVGQGVDGSLANDLFRVSGLVQTTVDLINRQAVTMSLADARVLFAFGDEAHEIVVHGRSAVDSSALTARLAAMPVFAHTEVLDWRTLAQSFVNILDYVDLVGLFILVLVLAAAAAGVANTMLMATFERTHEFGMLLALGAAPWRIVRLIVLESLILGLVGAAAGTVLGATLVEWGHRVGFDWTTVAGTGGSNPLSMFGMALLGRLYPRLAIVDLVRVVLAVLVTSLVASVWPAARVAGLQPAEALRD